MNKFTGSFMGANGAEDRANDQPETDLIDEHLFIEALALIAFEIQFPEPQPSHIERVNYI
jgi:hypothetical protein